MPLAALQWILIRLSHNHGYHGDGGFSLFGDDGGDDGGFLVISAAAIEARERGLSS